MDTILALFNHKLFRLIISSKTQESQFMVVNVIITGFLYNFVVKWIY